MFVNRDKVTFGPERTVEEIIQQLSALARNKKKYVFRGYEEPNELLPRIMRDKRFIEKEEMLLMDFERYGSNFFHAMNPIDFLSYAQHFGIPTRLLDFTYNPFIALSFALFNSKIESKNIDSDGYYYIQYALLEENICLPNIEHISKYSKIKKPIDSLAEKALECIKNVNSLYVNNNPIDAIYTYTDTTIMKLDQEKFQKRAILFVDPNQANQRIMMQQGLFMFPYTLDKTEHLRIIEQHSNRILIHQSHRNQLLEYLDTLGYNTFRLMPDLNSICEAIKRRAIENML